MYVINSFKNEHIGFKNVSQKLKNKFKYKRRNENVTLRYSEDRKNIGIYFCTRTTQESHIFGYLKKKRKTMTRMSRKLFASCDDTFFFR